MSDPRRRRRRRKPLIAGLGLRAEVQHRMRYLRAIGDLDAAEAMLARHFNAFAETPVCTDHSRAQVLGVAEPTKRRCLQLGGVGLARQLQAALVLAWPGVEGGRHRGDLLSAVRTQIGAFREVLTQQSVGVLVGATLPRALRIAEVDLDARIDLEARSLLPRWSRFAEIT